MGVSRSGEVWGVCDISLESGKMGEMGGNGWKWVDLVGIRVELGGN